MTEETTTLEGTLEHVVFASDDSPWSVVRLDVDGERGLVTAVGNLQGAAPGETVRLTGSWENDPKFGRQFRAESYLAVQPSTLVGIERYLGSGLIPGIGPVMAKRLVEKFGLDTLEVIENHPERLKQVPGIGPKRRAEIRRAWAEQRRVKDLMVFLQSHGVSSRYALKIYKTYGDETMGLVRRNPYRLARDIRGIGFLSADRIAASMGVPRDAPARIQAGVLHVLDQAAGEGHVYLPEPELTRKTAELLSVDPSLPEEALDRLARGGDVVAEKLPLLPGRSHEGEAVYLAALGAAEIGVAERLRALLDRPSPKVPLKIDKALEWFEKREGIELAPEQRRAVTLGLAEKLLVITGGPGTGKTTLIRAIVAILLKKGVKILLAAPTGRAAKRLSEATGMKARTIHRLLEFNAQTRGFERNAERPLTADLVILDEVSMLDVTLAHQMLRAVPDRGRLVLVGDVDQLPSVGPGKVLADLIRSQTLPVVRLTTIFRQARRSLIVVNAHRVNQGEMPLLGPRPESGDGGSRPSPDTPAAAGDFFFIPRSDPEEALETVCYLVTERIPDSFRLHPVEDIQVLTPMNRGALGAERLNAELKERLNPSRPGVTEIARGSRSFRTGDKVMQIRNNYDLGVFNGDVGRIESIDAEERQVVCNFDDHRVVHEFSSLDELVPAYACSVHKAQGSEYPCVVLPFHSQHWVMLRRNLLYTALTRARRLVVVVGETRALGAAVRSRRSEERWSGLAERLAGLHAG